MSFEDHNPPSYRVDLPPPRELFSQAAATAEGWRVPVEGQPGSWIYIGLRDIAFEVWLGGDYDVTVKLERPFRFGAGDELLLLDPRTSHRSDLALMLAICDFTVKACS